MRLGGLLWGGVGVVEVFASIGGGDIILAIDDGGIVVAAPGRPDGGTTAAGITPVKIGGDGTTATTPGCTAPDTIDILGTADPTAGIIPGCMAGGITGTAPGICCTVIAAVATAGVGTFGCDTMLGVAPGIMADTIVGLTPPAITIGATVAADAAVAVVAIISTDLTNGDTAPGIHFAGSKGLKLPGPVGVIVGVVPSVDNEANNVGGKALGTSMPRNFKPINLQAMLNSFIFILPSESVSANALKSKYSTIYIKTFQLK